MTYLKSRFLSKSKFTLFLIAIALLAIFTTNQSDFFKKHKNIATKKSIKQTAIPKNTLITSRDNPLNNPKIRSQITYPVLVRQQIQIESLQKEYKNLEDKLMKISHKDEISELIITFIELEKNIYSQKPYERQIKKFELLAKSDMILIKKIDELKSLLQKDIKTNKELSEEFTKLIPQIINKKPQKEDSFLDKIKYNLTKSISIRRIDGKVTNPSDNIDLIIIETQKLIEQGRFSRSCEVLSTAAEEYKLILNDFHLKITTAADLDKKISEIFSYLKELNNA